MNEADVSSKLRVALAAQGAKAMKVSDRFHASRPDLFVCYYGRFIVIETKMHPRKPTDAQTFELTDFVQHGAQTFVATYHACDKKLGILNMQTGHVASFTKFQEAAAWLLKPSCSSTKSVVSP